MRPRLRLPLGPRHRGRPHRPGRHHRRLPPATASTAPTSPTTSSTSAKRARTAPSTRSRPAPPSAPPSTPPTSTTWSPRPSSTSSTPTSRSPSPEARWLRGERAQSTPLDRSGPVTVWRVRGRSTPRPAAPATRRSARSPTRRRAEPAAAELPSARELSARERALPVGGGLARPAGADRRPGGAGAADRVVDAIRDELRRRIGPTFTPPSWPTSTAREPTGACRWRSTSRPAIAIERSRSPTPPSGSICAAPPTSPAAAS